MKLSVVIPTCGRAALLRRTIPSLLAQRVPDGGCEILVVVDGEPEATGRVVAETGAGEALRVLHTTHPRSGAAAARNLGIRAARGELVLFLDDDFLAAPGLLLRHCRAHEEGGAQAVFGPVEVDPSSDPVLMRYETARRDREWYGALDAAMKLHFPEPEPRALTITVLSFLVNASVPRRQLLEAGGFDESFPAAEDLELGLRLWKRGVGFRYCPEARVSEIYVKTARQHLSIQRQAMLGDLLVSRRHPEHRPYSQLAAFAEASTVKRWTRRWLMTSPVPPVPLVHPLFAAEPWLCRWHPLRAAATRLLRAAERIERLRAALGEMGSWCALEAEFGRSLPVLMYHNVGPLRGGPLDFLTVTPDHFERQMRWLQRRGYSPITCADWIRWRKEGKGLPAKPVMITFDDGYAGTAQYALPVLRRHGFPATVFLPTALLGKQNGWDAGRGAPMPLMTAEEVLRWDAEGIEFGAHSRTHANLTALAPDKARDEIRGSKEDLEALLGKPVAAFAYPYGKQNADVREMVRREFEIAFSVEEGLNYLRSDVHRMRRAYVSPFDSLPEFAWTVWHGTLGGFRRWRGRTGIRRRLNAWVSFAARGWTPPRLRD